MFSARSSAQSRLLAAFQPHNRLSTSLTLAALLASSALLWAVLDYRAWLAYGTGGFDPTLPEYWFILKVRLRRLLTHNYGRDPQELLDLARPMTDRFLDPANLPQREGPRPEMRSRPLPQRQTQAPSPSFATHLKSYFTHLASLNPTLLSASRSILERHGSALFVHPDASQLPQGDFYTRRWGNGEVAHVHEEEGSLHVVLTVLDASLVLERGWGERMPCVGIVEKVPLGNVLVYAPGTLEEVEVVKSIVLAGCRYFAGEAVVHYKSMFDAGSQILKTEGAKSLFKGAGANILRGVAGAGVLSLYDKMQELVFGKVYSGGA